LRDTSEWVDYQTFNSGIQSNSLTSIAVDQNNVKWIGSLSNGLIRFDEISFTNYNESNSPIPDDRINCLSVDNQNRIWTGTDFGIGIFNGSSWIIYNRNNSGLTSEIINSIRFDNLGNAWIGTSANLVKFDGASWILYNDPLSHDWIKDLYIESENKIWLATQMYGIFVLENGVVSEFPRTEYNYPTYSLTSLAPDQQGNIWFCFLSDTSGRGGISYWDGSSFTTFFPVSSGNAINHIFIDQQNNKWVSTQEGFILYDPLNSLQLFNLSNSLISSNLITASIKDINGNVWVTTQSAGLNKYKPSQ
jgi:ligand-binding sensor domain-containing protein